MSAIAVAIGGAALLGATATVVSSNNQANATKSAANQAANSQQSANQLNYQQFEESRGSTGSAVLPLYMQNPDGSLFEKSLSNDLVAGYSGSNVGLPQFQSATAPLQSAVTGANRTTNDIFNGGLTRQLLDNTAPVRTARTSLARASSLDALNKTLADINATQAGHGFGGDSYAGRLAEFGGYKAQGDALGAAHLQNVQDIADTTNYGNVTLPLQNLQTPGTVAGQAGQYAFMPQADWLNSINQRMQPLNEVRIGTSQPFQYQPLPTPGAGAYSGGANAISGVAGALTSGVGSYMQYQQNQNLVSALNNSAGGWSSAPGVVNPGVASTFPSIGSGAPIPAPTWDTSTQLPVSAPAVPGA